MDVFLYIPIVYLICVGILANLTDYDDTIGLQMIGFVMLVLMPVVGHVVYYM
jgi:hypothetical protein